MQVKFFDFSTYHGKNPPSGSTNIRVHQVIKYWEEASIYRYGEKPDVLIFQKVYCSPDYSFPRDFTGLKILDLCDPDWLDGSTAIKETVDAVDAITCSSDNLSEFIRQLTDKPVVTIADRFDLEVIPKPMIHKGDAKTVVWFGYRHNAEIIKAAMQTINELGLKLIVISNDDPMTWQWLDRQIGEDFRLNNYRYLKYDEERIYLDLQRADIAVLPQGGRPADHFKSNNRTVKSILAGLPVAKTGDELRNLIKAKNRTKYIEDNYDKTVEEYDIMRSVDQYKELIEKIK